MKLHYLAAPMVLALSACGGTTLPTITATSTDDTIIGLLDPGATISFGDEEISLAPEDLAGLSADRSYIATLQDGRQIQLDNYNTTWTSLFAGEPQPAVYHNFLGAGLGARIGDEDYYYMVIGARSLPDDLPTEGGANYSGETFGRVIPANGATSTEYLTGGVNIAVSFEKGFVSGDLFFNDSERLVSDTIFFNGNLNEDGSFGANMTFTALCIDPEACYSVNSSDLTGAFYGPDGAELAGTYSMEYTTVDDTDYILIGGFSSKGNLP